MAQTQAHRCKISRVKAIEKSSKLATNTTEKFKSLAIRVNLDTKFFVDRAG